MHYEWVLPRLLGRMADKISTPRIVKEKHDRRETGRLKATRSKLTDEQVRKIRADLVTMTTKAAASKNGVGYDTVIRIQTGQSYRYVLDVKSLEEKK